MAWRNLPHAIYQCNLNTPVFHHHGAGTPGYRLRWRCKNGISVCEPAANSKCGPDITACFGKEIRLDGSGSVNYQWSPSTYLSSATVPNPRVIQAPPGVYNYYLTVSSSTGCKSSKDRHGYRSHNSSAESICGKRYGHRYQSAVAT